LKIPDCFLEEMIKHNCLKDKGKLQKRGHGDGEKRRKGDEKKRRQGKGSDTDFEMKESRIQGFEGPSEGLLVIFIDLKRAISV
jgi:hypothetical protein